MESYCVQRALTSRARGNLDQKMQGEKKNNKSLVKKGQEYMKF